MRRALVLTFGLLELTLSIVLAAFAWRLPSSADVDGAFGRAARVTERTADQVRLLRRQVRDLRRPELHDLARRLEVQSKTVTAALKAQSFDPDAAQAVSGALGDVATGLDGFAQALDAQAIGKLGEGLGVTASYLDEKVAPAAAQAAARLDETTAELREDAKVLAELLRQAPPDLRAAREIHDGLARFGEGLDRVQGLLEGRRLGAMRDGFQGLETALTTGAGQVDRLAGYHYPVVTVRGLKPQVEERKFWPQGGDIAAGMRKAAAGARAADEEMRALEGDLPRLRASLDEGRKAADRTRAALALALKQQGRMEALLKNVPEHSARLAEELPRLSGDLARVLRETDRLKEVAAVMRQAQKGMETAAARWPELRTGLTRAAELLRTTRRQLDEALENRDEYEAVMRQTVTLAETFAAVLPLFVESLDHQLREQESGLADLGQSLDEVGDVIPAYGEAARGLAGTGRLLAWIVTGLVAAHGAYLTAGAAARRNHNVATRLGLASPTPEETGA